LLALLHASEILREASEGGGWITRSLYKNFSKNEMLYEQWLKTIPSLATKSLTLESFACAVSLGLAGN
jgi:hypothetical protein